MGGHLGPVIARENSFIILPQRPDDALRRMKMVSGTCEEMCFEKRWAGKSRVAR
jgi:hypothetical protein